jgi:hypothetical protein
MAFGYAVTVIRKLTATSPDSGQTPDHARTTRELLVVRARSLCIATILVSECLVA